MKAIIALGLLIVVLSIGSCNSPMKNTYEGPILIKGRVLDAASRDPISSAKVLITWYYYVGFLSIANRTIREDSVETDANGYFSLDFKEAVNGEAYTALFEGNKYYYDSLRSAYAGSRIYWNHAFQVFPGDTIYKEVYMTPGSVLNILMNDSTAINIGDTLFIHLDCYGGDNWVYRFYNENSDQIIARSVPSNKNVVTAIHYADNQYDTLSVDTIYCAPGVYTYFRVNLNN